MASIKSSGTDPESLSAVHLRDGCRERKPDNSHEPYCFEMFRRAIVEKSEHCWSLIYQQYERLVYEWVFEVAGDGQGVGLETHHSLVVKAFSSFWRAFDTGKLEKAMGLAPVLSYLKSCTVTTVLQAKRTQRNKKEEVEIDGLSFSEPSYLLRSDINVGRTMEEADLARRLWGIVEGVCRNDRERIVAWLSFVSDCTPDKIMTLHPGFFDDSKEISEIRRSLKNRLFRNQELRKLLEE